MFMRPEHWSPQPAGQSSSLFSVVSVKDEKVLKSLRRFLGGSGIGDGGKDQKVKGTYDRLKLVEGWRVENHGLLWSYVAERGKALAMRGQGKVDFSKYQGKVISHILPNLEMQV